MVGKKFYAFDCYGDGVPPTMVVHAKCLEVAKREAQHRLEKIWPRDEFHGARVDLTSGREEADRGYFIV